MSTDVVGDELKAMDEGYVYDVDYIQAPSIKELKAKVRKALEKEYEPEGIPFLDTTVEPNLWTQMMLQMAYGDEEESDKEEEK